MARTPHKPTDRVAAAAKAVAANTVRKRPKSNRTLSLDFERFEALAAHCREQDLKVSNVVDDLIAAYLAAAT